MSLSPLVNDKDDDIDNDDNDSKNEDDCAL